ncbi:MAG TPA: CBS domain-containing protein [bacterium]|nr:CBS domain-containing protein [bacterium]
MLVRDMMNNSPGTIAPEATLADALQLMAQKKNRHLIVVNNDEVLGILSDRDLALYYDPDGMTEERWKQTQVKHIMTANPVAIGSAAPVREAARLLLKSAVSALPVIDNGQLVGVLSDRDFTRHFAQSE